MSSEVSDRYLDLMRGVLTGSLFLDEEFWEVGWTMWKRQPLHKRIVVRVHDATLGRTEWRLMRRNPNPRRRETGGDWPPTAETMIEMRRLDNIQDAIRTVINEDIPGDVAETGVWRGGGAIFMRAALVVYGGDRRLVWAADSFTGLPPPDAAFPADADDVHSSYLHLAIPLEEVKTNFRRFGLLDDRVRFLEGWFEETLPKAPIEQLAVLRLDGDMYSSTIQALNALYPKLSPGGYLIVDDFDLPGCRAAVTDYRERHDVDEEIIDIDGKGAFWRRVAG